MKPPWLSIGDKFIVTVKYNVMVEPIKNVDAMFSISVVSPAQVMLHLPIKYNNFMYDKTSEVTRMSAYKYSNIVQSACILLQDISAMRMTPILSFSIQDMCLSDVISM